MSEAQTVLLVGATGAVGVPTVHAMREAGHHVRALVRNPERGQVAADAGAEPVVGDLFDAATVVPHLKGVDALVNLATRIPSPIRAALPGAWRENDRIRRDGSTALVDAALQAGVARFVQESVVFQYADGGDAWIDEDAPLALGSVVDATEVAEANVARFAADGGAGVVLRFGLFYGAGSSHTEGALAMVRRGLSPALGAADAFQPSIHLEDAARALVAALAAAGGTYNVTDDEPVTKVEYGRALAAALGVDPPRLVPRGIVKAMGKKVDPIARSQRVSNDRFEAATGWAPSFPSVHEGFATLAEDGGARSRG